MPVPESSPAPGTGRWADWLGARGMKPAGATGSSGWACGAGVPVGRVDARSGRRSLAYIRPPPGSRARHGRVLKASHRHRAGQGAGRLPSGLRQLVRATATPGLIVVRPRVLVGRGDRVTCSVLAAALAGSD